jgi:N-acetylneuraminic acid mutarotase
MRFAWSLIIFFGIILAISANAENKTIPMDLEVLSISQRISCQRAIEEVYWNHRTWPQNSQPRPDLNEILSDTAVESKVEDSLRKSNALEKFWNRPILAEELQSEIDRIERETKQAKMLREIYSALDDDPLVVAECLARPIVADRKIRQWYAYDSRFHGDPHARAFADLSKVNTVEDMQLTSGHYEEQEWIRVENNFNQDPGKISLSPEEWTQWKKELQSQLNNFPEEIVTAQSRATIIPGKISRLQEDEHRFYAIAVLSESDERIRIAAISWQKLSFDDWWNRIKYSIPTETKISPQSFSIQKSKFPTSECVNDSWSQTPMPMVGEGFGHTAVWTGSEMIVWGGSNRGIYLNTGARYDPTTDVWTPISNLGAPSPRLGHKAIWTGSEMIIWGGYFSLNTGGRYNPVTDTWVTTTTVNAPAGRYYHSAIWTGTEMIIWGGYNGNELNSGGRYNPGTDTWASTSITNAPEPRTVHSATWIGTEMIVWGGRSGSYFNDGFRYNPNTDVWTLISNANAPEPRGSHSAIWSGSELIIWGGSNQTTYFNNGARYSPPTNSWNPLSNVNSPSARSSASAVWTGTDMIVWGGVGCPDPPSDCSSATLLSSGGVYNPTNNFWVETEKMGAPSDELAIPLSGLAPK